MTLGRVLLSAGRSFSDAADVDEIVSGVVLRLPVLESFSEDADGNN